MVVRLLPSRTIRATLTSCAARQLFFSPAQSVSVQRFRVSLILALFAAVAATVLAVPPAFGQKNKKPEEPKADLVRTITRHETHRLPYGGTVSIVGAPAGSITIEGWDRSEIDVAAEIELHGPTNADLDLLATVNNFVVDVDTIHVRILTSGTHDKKYMQAVAKKFPKNLFGLPWKVDFHIKMPALTDIEIDAGVGPLKLSGVEGAMRVNALQSDAELTLTGGYFSGIIQRGTVTLTVPVRSWHGLGMSLQLAGGTLDVGLASGFSGDIGATVLRLGEIKNTYDGLAPLEGGAANPRLLEGRAGSGGAKLSFTVGDGTITIRQLSGDK